MGWDDEDHNVAYENVPEDLKRKIVESCTVRITCPDCGADWYDQVIAGHNHRTECPNGHDYTVVG